MRRTDAARPSLCCSCRQRTIIGSVKNSVLSPVFCLFVAVGGAFATARAAVEVEGLEEPLRMAVLSAVTLNREPCDAPDWRIAALEQRAPDEVRSALEADGYYSAAIESEIERSTDCWLARITVDPGQPVTIRDLALSITGEAADDPDFNGILAGTTLTEGKQLDQREYERVKSALAALAGAKGYPEARFSESRIDIYPADLAADIALELESGDRYTFGEIDINQDFLNYELVDGYITFETGDPFDRQELTNLYNALIDSGYFGLVDIRPLPEDPELHQIPVQIDLMPGNRKVLSYGGGYSTDTGPRLRITRTNRRLNARGAQLSLNLELSPVLSEFYVTHRFPLQDPQTEWISLDAGIVNEQSDTVDSQSLELGARRIIERWEDWQETQFINYLVEDFTLAEEVDRSKLLQPGMSWLRVRADNTVRPTHGDRLSFEISAASNRFASDASLLQTIVAARWIRSLPGGARVLTRIRAGATWNHDFDALPPSTRFFAGGDSSVRGYEFKSQGPVDADGLVIGGDRLIVASVEYEHRLKERWSFATFYDAGNAFRRQDLNAVAGFGIGARWFSPLGPIRIDIAKPLDGIDRGLRLHVNIGPDL
jgi:translocation and assembly module TamA